MLKNERRLRVGLLGCGPIAQAAHLDAIRKARNADLRCTRAAVERPFHTEVQACQRSA